VLILKRVLFEGHAKKRLGLFGEQRNDEIWKIKKKRNTAIIINMYAVN